MLCETLEWWGSVGVERKFQEGGDMTMADSYLCMTETNTTL